MKMAWNEDADEYGMTWRCSWIWYEMKIQTNTFRDKDVDKYGIKQNKYA